MTQDSNLEHSLVPFTGNSLMPSVYQRLEASMERYNIPALERQENQDILGRELTKDKEKQQKSLESEIAKYQAENNGVRRFIGFISRGFKKYRPEISENEPSPETEIYQSLISLQKSVGESYDLLIDLPKIVKQMSSDYQSLEAEEKSLTQRVRTTEALLEDAPAKIKSYEELRNSLVGYQRLSHEEKINLSLKIESDGSLEKIPPLKNPGVRKVYLRRTDEFLDQLKNNSFGSSSTLQIDREELSRVKQDKDLLLQQYHELEQGWSPALQALHKLKRQYDKVRRVAPGARLAIGLNKIREDSINQIAEAERVIANALSAVEESKARAQIAEDIDAEVRGLLE